jgi:hypothetical protein
MPPKPTARQLAANQLYADLMDEAKAKFAAIDAAINGRLGLPAALVREFGFLQLRLLCELIALACLTAHGDIKEARSSKLNKEYAADKIIEKLAELHPNFYPRPIWIYAQHQGPPTPYRDSPGVHIEPRECVHLTKEELPTLYGMCGNFLHRGTSRKLASSRSPQQMQFAGKDFTAISQWTGKIIRLLEIHMVSSIDNYEQILCALADEAQGNRVQVYFAQAPRSIEP